MISCINTQPQLYRYSVGIYTVVVESNVCQNPGDRLPVLHVFAQRLEATGDTQEAIKQLENLLSVGNPS